MTLRQGSDSDADVSHLLGGESYSGASQKPDRPGFRPQIRRTWKGYDFGILNELTDEGLVNAGNRSKSASFTDEGEAKALELLKQYGIALEQHNGKKTGGDGTPAAK